MTAAEAMDGVGAFGSGEITDEGAPPTVYPGAGRIEFLRGAAPTIPVDILGVGDDGRAGDPI